MLYRVSVNIYNDIIDPMHTFFFGGPHILEHLLVNQIQRLGELEKYSSAGRTSKDMIQLSFCCESDFLHRIDQILNYYLDFENYPEEVFVTEKKRVLNEIKNDRLKELRELLSGIEGKFYLPYRMNTLGVERYIQRITLNDVKSYCKATRNNRILVLVCNLANYSYWIYNPLDTSINSELTFQYSDLNYGSYLMLIDKTHLNVAEKILLDQYIKLVGKIMFHGNDRFHLLSVNKHCTTLVTDELTYEPVSKFLLSSESAFCKANKSVGDQVRVNLSEHFLRDNLAVSAMLPYFGCEVNDDLVKSYLADLEKFRVSEDISVQIQSILSKARFR